MTVEHLPEVRGLRIANEQTGKTVFVRSSLVRSLSAVLLDAVADMEDQNG